MLYNQPLEIADSYRSGLESTIAEQLKQAGIEFAYEQKIVPYNVPARTAKYKADFPIPGTNIIIEGKGHFGGNSATGRFSNMRDNSAKQRQKFALLKEQHPDLDIRFVFTRSSSPIYKGSKTTHADWCKSHGFLYADKRVPQAWLDEIKKQQESACLPSTVPSASSQARGKSSRTYTRGKASVRLRRKSATASRASRQRSMTCDKRATGSKRN